MNSYTWKGYIISWPEIDFTNRANSDENKEAKIDSNAELNGVDLKAKEQLKNETKAELKLNIIDYYNLINNEIDIKTERYLLDIKEEDAELEDIRQCMIERVESLKKEQLEEIEKSENGRPISRYCYLIEDTLSKQLDIKLIMTNLQINKQMFNSKR
jgi:hypothetical protein